MRYHFGIGLFHESYPSGTATCEHGHGFIGLDAVYKFARLFHYCEVRRNIHVKYCGGIETPYRGDHFAFHVGTNRHVERFAERCFNGRCGYEDNFFGSIVQCRPYLVYVALFGERAYGAVDNTLSSAHAGRFGERAIKSAAYMDVKASAYGADCVNTLFLAGVYAAHAVYALVIVADKIGGGVVEREHEVLALESVLVHAVSEGQSLQFAAVVTLARKTFLFVFAQNEFQRHFSRLAAFFRVGAHLHAFRYGIDARGDESSRTCRFDHAHTA